MSGGGGSTETTVTNQSMPKEFFPYFENVLDRGEAASLEPYQAYGGQRLADVSGDTNASGAMIRNVANAGMPGTEAAMGMANNIYSQAGQVGKDGPYKFSQFGYSGPGTFTGDAIQQYMSPYMQNVVDIQKTAALEDYQIADQSRAAQAVQAGAFGGSRQGVQQGMAERDLLSRTNQIQAQGLQDSFMNAQGLFEADRQARMANEQARAAELSRVQAGQSAENLARANLGLNALQLQSTTAQQLASLEQAARAGDIQAAQLLQAQGASQEARSQAGLDMAYQDYLRQQSYPMDQLERYASMLHGSPVANATTTSTSVPTNPYQQALGMGISALGLYNAYS